MESVIDIVLENNSMLKETTTENISTASRARSWILCTQHLPRLQIVFAVQSLLIFLLVTVSITCIAFAKTCEETTVWVAILSSSVGYMLPSPKL